MLLRIQTPDTEKSHLNRVLGKLPRNTGNIITSYGQNSVAASPTAASILVLHTSLNSPLPNTVPTTVPHWTEDTLVSTAAHTGREHSLLWVCAASIHPATLRRQLLNETSLSSPCKTLLYFSYITFNTVRFSSFEYIFPILDMINQDAA